MYLKKTTSYYRGTEAVVMRAPFLILISPDCGKTLYGIVRRVALKQCGAWMMGRANIGGRWIVLSGSYGNDGLPMGVEKLGQMPADAVQLPADLVAAWSSGGGWNSAGSEAESMRQWACDTFKKEVA